MEEPEKIEGKNLSDLLKELQTNGTLIKVTLPGKDYEQLTMITHIRALRRNPFFLMDYPEGFREAFADIKDLKMQFEFTGKDKVNYSFLTSGWEIYRDEIRVRFPEFINRHQRRGDFRIDAPPQTRLHAQLKSTMLKMKVLNISLGGTLVVLAGPWAISKNKKVFVAGDYLKDIELIFPLEGKDFKVHIEKAKAVRLEEGPSKAKNCCALQFVRMEENEEKTLTGLIYKYQRQFLKSKPPINT
jgi:c-di-GMP-binding flagellar brake protein YcgR